MSLARQSSGLFRAFTSVAGMKRQLSARLAEDERELQALTVKIDDLQRTHETSMRAALTTLLELARSVRRGECPTLSDLDITIDQAESALNALPQGRV